MFHKVYRAVFLSLFGHKEPNNHIYIEQYAVSSLESSEKHRKQKFAFHPPSPPPPRALSLLFLPTFFKFLVKILGS